MTIRNLAIAMFLCSGCIESVHANTETEQGSEDLASANSCNTVLILPQGGTGVVAAPPAQSIVSDFVRPMFPDLYRRGSWSGATFVADRNGLVLPAVTATGDTPGWLTVPFESGETLTGLSFFLCGNPQTTFSVDTFATNIADVLGDGGSYDSLNPTGSAGTTSGIGPVWRRFDMVLLPRTLNAGTMVHVQVGALAITGTRSMAMGSVVAHFIH